MIRIDEIYTNTFWPWIEQNIFGNRLFYCDPPGHTNVNNLFNHGRDDIQEIDYIFFHDQEPIHVDIFKPLFDEVVRRNDDLQPNTLDLPGARGSIIVSEKNSDALDALLATYGWRCYYYFYHGWAALDWYRGYDKTFLIKRAVDRSPTKTFMSPNRIVGGHRDHRVLFLYEVFKRGLQGNHLSAPRTCPEEKTDITHIASKYTNQYSDITRVLGTEDLPITFPNEDTQKMTSCWLDNFDIAADSMFYVPTETVYWGRRNHITEKTFKAIALEMPFILVAPAHSLQYLRSYGFQTFGDTIDESYDEEEDDFLRLQKVGQLLEDINNLSTSERMHIWKHCSRVATHNFHHFYNGRFEEVLWKELKLMLEQLKRDHV